MDEEYAFYTGKASELVRQLALAGFALIWLFKKDVGGVPQVPVSFRGPAIVLLGSLAFDFLQYAVSAPLWHWFKRKLQNKGLKADEEQTAPNWMYWGPDAFFYLKMVALGYGYFLLVSALLANQSVFAPSAAAPPPGAAKSSLAAQMVPSSPTSVPLSTRVDSASSGLVK